MIAVLLEGRMGNQLFQFAFAHAISKKLKSKFYMDASVEPFLLSKYFDLSIPLWYNFDYSIFKIKGFKNLFTYYARKLFFNLIKKMYGLQVSTFHNANIPEEEIEKITPNTLFKGFFQSEKYFLEIKKELNTIFTIKNEFKKSYQHIISGFSSNQTYIAIHIRKGDYVNLGLDLPMSYFHEAIKEISATNAFYIFLSDNPELIAEEFNYLQDKYISKNSEIIDFQFLVNADICILSNSSFSWWGAYLNTKNPKIYAPKYWLGNEFEFPNSVIPINWIKL